MLVLLLLGCSDRLISTDAKAPDECYADCGTYMSRHWCSSVDVNYTSIRISNTTTAAVSFLPLTRETTLGHNCSCTARSCLW